MRQIALLLVLLTSFYTSSQITIKGHVSSSENAKLLFRIYQSGESITNHFHGNFELTIDSLGGTYYFDATGYIGKKIVIKDTAFLSITLLKSKDYEKLAKRSRKRQKRSMKKVSRLNKRGKMIYGGCCFVSGTKILMASHTQKNIEMLVIGDSITSYDFSTKKIIVSTIQEIDTVHHENIIEIALERNVSIKNTTDHPYYIVGKGICSFDPQQTYDNYGIEAKQMKIGDECYFFECGKLKYLKIESIEIIPGVFKTYNLSKLHNNNNYFVNGVLVNNEKEFNNSLRSD